MPITGVSSQEDPEPRQRTQWAAPRLQPAGCLRREPSPQCQPLTHRTCETSMSAAVKPLSLWTFVTQQQQTVQHGNPSIRYFLFSANPKSLGRGTCEHLTGRLVHTGGRCLGHLSRLRRPPTCPSSGATPTQHPSERRNP